jgi:hypothetical protein
MRLLRQTGLGIADFAGFDLSCRSGWTQDGGIATLPAGVEYVTAWLAVDGPFDSQVWFDDVEVSFS